ncbi:hypothetical protein BOO69_05230 [Sulfitobacter alexandrii]|uniref:Metanogen output domain-containing protein n=1 Tax=Sulfitobacter alexandrii TaxID=1917485 RepID=A0A1J0WEZ6_9RHOB|nr:methanogen output domain 1-containing protein [Sulfitobacter alexandrii]APE42890.1 hypothetical protein BOO69_05230 [Sulfitobacter alexandrii]
MTHDLPEPERAPAVEKDAFMRSVLRQLMGLLEQTIGESEAEAYVNYVGVSLGRIINADYRAAYAVQQLDTRQVAATLVDLKARLEGGFSIESIDAEKIVLVNTACPFGESVVGLPSICRMTANIFGHVTAENLGYARVTIDKSIARGDPGCRVIVRLVPPDHAPATGESEFFGSAV